LLVANKGVRQAEEPVQTGLAKRGRRSYNGSQRCRADATRKPERRRIPQAPMSMETGTGSAVGWVNLTTCDSSGTTLVCSCCPSRFGDPKGGILRLPSAIGFNPAVGDEADPRPPRELSGAGPSPWSGSEASPRMPSEKGRRSRESQPVGNVPLCQDVSGAVGRRCQRLVERHPGSVRPGSGKQRWNRSPQPARPSRRY
jgi:hypothetical protein